MALFIGLWPCLFTLNCSKLSCSSEVTLLIKGPFKEARGRNTVTQHCDATGGGSEKQKLDKLIKSSLKIKLLRRQNDKMIYIFPARREYVI